MQKLARGETEPEAPPRVIRHGELQIRGNQTTYNLNSILANNIKASMYYNKIRQWVAPVMGHIGCFSQSLSIVDLWAHAFVSGQWIQYLKSSMRLQNLSLTSVCILLNPFLLSSCRLADRIFTEPWVARTNRLPSTAFSLMFTLFEIRVTEMEMHQILHHKVSWCSVLISHLYLIFMHNHNHTFFVHTRCFPVDAVAVRARHRFHIPPVLFCQ